MKFVMAIKLRSLKLTCCRAGLTGKCPQHRGAEWSIWYTTAPTTPLHINDSHTTREAAM